jgi:hypothetical protein
MANRLGRMPLPPKVNAFQGEVSRNQRLVTRRNLQNGAIVSDASGDAPRSASPSADARDQSFFGIRQNAPIHPDRPNIQGGSVLDESNRTMSKPKRLGNSSGLQPIENTPLVVRHGRRKWTPAASTG